MIWQLLKMPYVLDSQYRDITLSANWKHPFCKVASQLYEDTMKVSEGENLLMVVPSCEF